MSRQNPDQAAAEIGATRQFAATRGLRLARDLIVPARVPGRRVWREQGHQPQGQLFFDGEHLCWIALNASQPSSRRALSQIGRSAECVVEADNEFIIRGIPERLWDQTVKLARPLRKRVLSPEQLADLRERGPALGCARRTGL